MTETVQPAWIAFAGTRQIASGRASDVATQVKNLVDKNDGDPVLVFDAVTSHPVELDLRGSVAAVLQRLSFPSAPDSEPAAQPPTNTPRSPGRPKLGVTAREVTLLPRHWDWLASQPGSASVTLRKLVEQAMRAGRQEDQVRQAREAAYRFMSAMAGDAPGFEEAARALFAGDSQRFLQAVAKWPVDVRKHALALAQAAVPGGSQDAVES